MTAFLDWAPFSGEHVQKLGNGLFFSFSISFSHQANSESVRIEGAKNGFGPRPAPV